MNAEVEQRLVPGIVGISTYVDCVYQHEMQRAAVGGSLDRPINRLRSVTATLDFGRFVDELRAGRPETAEEQIADATETLEASGAGFLVVTSGTGSTLTGLARQRAALPILDLAASSWADWSVADPGTVGLLSTRRAASDGNFHAVASRHGVSLLLPPPETAERVDEVIFEELVRGKVTPRAIHVMQDAIDGLTRRGAAAIILGNTDMTLAAGRLREATSAVLVDAARAHARMAARVAMGGRAPDEALV